MQTWTATAATGISQRLNARAAVASGCAAMDTDSPAPLSQVFVEPGERTVPRERGGVLVVARRRVVVEAVLRALVDVALVRHAGRLERFVVGGPGRGKACVHFAVMNEHR